MKYVVLKKDCKFNKMQTPEGTFEHNKIYPVKDSFIPYSEMKVFKSEKEAQEYLAKDSTKTKKKQKKTKKR